MAFDVEGALKAGYTEADIASYLAEQKGFDLAGARKAGYSDGDIVTHLVGKPAPTAAPAAEAKPTTEFAPGEEAVKGVKSGVSAVKSMWEGAGIAKDVGVATQTAKALDLYSQIDKGALNRSNLTPEKAGGDMSPVFRDAMTYLMADEKKRQQLRDRATSELQNRKDFVNAAVKTIQQYQEENKKNKGRTENLTDIEGIKDFTNWLSFNLGSGAVQMAPVMLAAITTGGPGAYLVGTGMELGGATQNRLEFILNKTKDEKDPEKRAKAIFDYVQKTQDASLAQAISSGAVDVLLGPVADVIKQPLKQAVREKTRKEIAKQVAKAVPRQVGEEGLAGGTQETIAIAAERALEEQTGEALTPENIKRVVNAAAAEAVGGGGVSAVTGAARVALGPQAEEAAPAARVEPTVEAPPATPQDARVQTLTQAYIDKGFMPDDASLLAQQDIAALEGENVPTPEPSPAVAEPVTDERGIPLPSGAERAAGVPASPIDRGLGLASSAAGQLAGREETERVALEEQQLRSERAAASISRRFNEEPYPDLGNMLGADWVRTTLAQRPTPQEYEEAAYARLEELNGQPPADAGLAFERRAPAAPTMGERPEAVPEPAAAPAVTEEVEAPPVVEATKPVEEKPRGIETPKAVEAKAQRPAEPAEGAAPTGLELEAARRPELEVEPEVEVALKNIDEHMKAVYGTTATGEARKRATGAGRPETGAAKPKEERAAQTKEINQLTRDVNLLLNTAKENEIPHAVEGFATVAEYEHREAVREKILDQVRMALHGLSQRARTRPITAYVKAAEYMRGLKPAEQARAKGLFEGTITPKELPPKPAEVTTKTQQKKVKELQKGLEPKAAAERTDLAPLERDLYVASQQLDMEADPAFYDVDSMAGALVLITQSPNQLEAELAARLLQPDNAPTLRNVKFVVVDKDTKLKDKNAKRLLDANTVGLYAPTTAGGDVYVRGESYDNQGINNEIVLHEAMHVSGSKKIDYAIAARNNGLQVDADLAQAVDDLEALMGRAKDAYDSKKGKASAELRFLEDSGAFTDIQEFYAYGMTNAAMKQFLLNEVKGISEKKSGFDTFIDILMRLFRIDPNMRSGLKDLVLISHELMGTRQPTEAELAAAFVEDNNRIGLEARKQSKTSEKAERKLEAAESASEVVEQMGSLMQVAKNPKLWVDYLRVNYKNIATPVYKGYLAVLPVNVLVDLAEAFGIGNVKELNAQVQKMHTFRTKMLRTVQDLATPWIQLNAKEQKKLADVMHYSTDVQKDPTVDKSDARLNARWNALDKKAKDIYVNIRDFYKNNYNLYRALLSQRVKNSGLNPDERQSLMDAIRESFVEGAKISPYFPFMRYGDYWVSFGKGTNKEFYMFESPGERDLFQKRRAAELRRRDPNIEIEAGNDIKSMRSNLQGDSIRLKQTLALIDGLQSADAESKAALKDEVFQLHLMSMPEASFRKQFIHRKGTIGFSGDALRNFIMSGTKFANQLPRIKYGPDIRNLMGAAEASLEGDPDRPKKGMVTTELGLRMKDELEPVPVDNALDKLARGVNRAAFVWLLTSVHSAANQLFSLANFTLPTLAKYHGWGAATAELTKTIANMYTQVGTTTLDKDGNVTFTPPTMMNNRSLRLTPIEQRAYQVMLDRGIADATRTYDLFLRKGQPSATYNDKTAKIVNALGALFHLAESVSREITCMAAFRLNIRKMSFEDAIENAIHTVNESLFDYSPWNTPRALKSAPARVVTQFMKFPLFVAIYLARNARAIFKPMDNETRTGAAKALFGTLGITGLLAGTQGLPLFGTLMGIAQGLRNLMADDDEEIVLEEDDLMRWFRNVWLPETFGDVEIMGMNLAELIDSGVLNAATGYDFASGISLNNMWFRDAPEASSWKDAYAASIQSLLGPGVGLGESWASAIDDINKGDTLKGFEKLIPGLVRGTMTAYRYSEEGAVDSALRPIKEADEFTNAQLLMQAAGFKTTGLAKVMEDNFAIRQMQQKILQQRGGLISNLDRASTMGRDTDFDKTLEKIDEYNMKYPSPDLRIDYDDIQKAMERRRKALMMSERGMLNDPKFRDFDVLRERGLELIEKEAAE